MEKYKLKFEVENSGPIEFDVTKETFNSISDFCKQNYPDIDWKTYSK